MAYNESCIKDFHYCDCYKETTCIYTTLHNEECDQQCNNDICDYDLNNCGSNDSNYIGLLAIVGFIIIALSFCLIFTIMVWYYRKRRNDNFSRISSTDESGRFTLSDINNKLPEYKCPEKNIGEVCVICLDE